CERSDNPIRSGRWRLLKAWLNICLGIPTESLTRLRQLKRDFEALGAQRDVALACEYERDALGLMGDDAGAIRAYDEAVGTGRRVSVASDVVIESLRKTAEAYARTGELSKALGAVRQATVLSKTYTEPLERAALIRIRGIINIHRGRTNRGIELLETSWATF